AQRQRVEACGRRGEPGQGLADDQQRRTIVEAVQAQMIGQGLLGDVLLQAGGEQVLGAVHVLPDHRPL
ncbi:hypothetical protein ACCD02_32835, partial [Pseudomonas sp. Pseusp88]|uniref:hypothetical protein n=1 Tax=Pseudomonas sp. Pseusp88 TaxID=3243061 RepID=UPI0039A6C708